METLRAASCEFMKRTPRDRLKDFTDFTSSAGFTPSLDQLWRDISSNDDSIDHSKTLENLLVAQNVLRSLKSNVVSSEEDVEAANALYAWLARISLPAAEFADSLEAAYSDNKEKSRPLTETLRNSQVRLSLGVAVLGYLNNAFPLDGADNAADVVTSLASFTSERDPWTTAETRQIALSVLESCLCSRDCALGRSLWPVLEDVLKSRIKPLFAKTKNPAITAAGRKNFHPPPRPRFDMAAMDPETKPWKFGDVYATTVLEWILSRYLPSELAQVEAHFPLLVPAILALIDDESLPFKVRGCSLLSMFLTPLKEGHSDILQRTNLSSVFEDALVPCFLSIPTITPEDEALQLLGAAYPALLSVLRIRYQNASSEQVKEQKTAKANRDIYIRHVANILRTNVIPSFHHISSTTVAEDSLIASFPFPRLSTFLLEQINILLPELGIHTTKYLQEIIPPVCTALANPFGPAHPPLLLAAVAAARCVILNAHPRIWRWRGELLGALCDCWSHVIDEEDQFIKQAKKPTPATSPDRLTSMQKLRKQLRDVVYLLKVAVISVTETNKVAGGFEENWVGLDEEIHLENELADLAAADERLRELLFAEV